MLRRVIGEPTGQVVEDAADAPLMEARPCGDLVDPEPFHPQSHDLPVSRRTRPVDLLPELASLRHLARPGQVGLRQVARLGLDEGLLPLQAGAVLLVAIGQPSPGDSPEEGEELGAAVEPPVALAEPVEDVGEDRLHDVHRVDLRTEPPRQSPADRDPQVWLISEQDPLDRLGVAFVEATDPVLQRVVVHGDGTLSQCDVPFRTVETTGYFGIPDAGATPSTPRCFRQRRAASAAASAAATGRRSVQ